MIDIRRLLSLLQTHIILQQETPRGIGTTWQQAPVIFEDALGNIFPIPLELVDSWEVCVPGLHMNPTYQLTITFVDA